MRKILTCLFVFLGFGFIQAQITVTSSDLLGLIGTSDMFESDTTTTIMNVNVGNAGANQVWDLSGVQLTSITFPMEYVDPQNTPYANSFPTANFAQKMTFSFDSNNTSEMYQYRNITPTQFITLGDVNADPINGAYIDSSSKNIVDLPLQYQQSWQFVSYDTTEFYPGYIVFNMDSSDFVVDGWGTVKVASGTYDCLRLRENWYNISHSQVNSVDFPPDTSWGISYTWIAKAHFMVAQVSSLDYETNLNFTTASEFQRLSSVVALERFGIPPLVRNFTLEQNYPNPFNPVTNIRFELNHAMPVTLDIYALNGQHVARLLHGMMAAGNHSIQFDATNLASGIYVYRLQTPKFSAVRRMVLIK